MKTSRILLAVLALAALLAGCQQAPLDPPGSTADGNSMAGGAQRTDGGIDWLGPTYRGN